MFLQINGFSGPNLHMDDVQWDVADTLRQSGRVPVSVLTLGSEKESFSSL